MILARGEKTDGVALRHCWFAQNITEEQHATLTEWLGCEPRQLYGMTETIPAVLTDTDPSPRCDSMGFVTQGCSVELHGPTW
jgi:crotonobetaine/carnitine-CoA ligase